MSQGQRHVVGERRKGIDYEVVFWPCFVVRAALLNICPGQFVPTGNTANSALGAAAVDRWVAAYTLDDPEFRSELICRLAPHHSRFEAPGDGVQDRRLSMAELLTCQRREEVLGDRRGSLLRLDAVAAQGRLDPILGEHGRVKMGRQLVGKGALTRPRQAADEKQDWCHTREARAPYQLSRSRPFRQPSLATGVVPRVSLEASLVLPT